MIKKITIEKLAEIIQGEFFFKDERRSGEDKESSRWRNLID